MKKILLITLLLLGISTIAQDEVKPEKVINKGKFFAYWGWNWAAYSDSDIHFKGKGYDFTLNDVAATDRQTKFDFYYYFIECTIPQTNNRIGYFFHENYTVSLGVDHMKYVVVADQKANIDGQIAIGNKYDGSYKNDEIKLTRDFLRLEHTDGLNYVNAQLYRFDDISHWFGLHSKNFQVNLTEGIGLGVLFPRTNASLLGKERWDEFHVSGYGSSVGAGLNLTFLKYFFVQTDLKAGYIYMPDIRTTSDATDSASQSFSFLQRNILFGGVFRF